MISKRNYPKVIECLFTAVTRTEKYMLSMKRYWNSTAYCSTHLCPSGSSIKVPGMTSAISPVGQRRITVSSR